MGSRSTTRSSETNLQQIENRNLAQSDFEGIAVGDAGDVSIVLADSGALAVAENLGMGALNLAGDVTGQAIFANVGVLDRAFEFGEGLVSDSLDTLSGAVTKVSESTRSDSANVLNNITKFGAIALAVITLGFIVTRARA